MKLNDQSLDQLPPWFSEKQTMLRRQANAELFRMVMLAAAHITQDVDGSLHLLAAIESKMAREVCSPTAPRRIEPKHKSRQGCGARLPTYKAEAE